MFGGVVDNRLGPIAAAAAREPRRTWCGTCCIWWGSAAAAAAACTTAAGVRPAQWKHEHYWKRSRPVKWFMKMVAIFVCIYWYCYCLRLLCFVLLYFSLSISFILGGPWIDRLLDVRVAVCMIVNDKTCMLTWQFVPPVKRRRRLDFRAKLCEQHRVVATEVLQWLKKLPQCFNNVDYMLNTIGSKLCNIPETFCQILGYNSYKLCHI